MAQRESTTLTRRELVALARYQRAYVVSAALGLTDHQASRLLWVRWLVATGRLGADDQAPDRES